MGRRVYRSVLHLARPSFMVYEWVALAITFLGLLEINAVLALFSVLPMMGLLFGLRWLFDFRRDWLVSVLRRNKLPQASAILSRDTVPPYGGNHP